MPAIRLTLKSVSYPDIAPNSVLVLQSLSDVGFEIILKNMKYRDREEIAEYFNKHNLSVSFRQITKPDIDVVDYQALVGTEKISNVTPETIWEEIDKLCLSRQIYERNAISSYMPTYKKGYFFLVLDYGLSSQLVDSIPVTYKGAHQKGSRIMGVRPNIKTMDLVDSTTLKIVEHFDKACFKFLPASEEVYFNVTL